MKGTKWNGTGICSKGRTKKERSSMFSVGGSVAFEETYYMSPDGWHYYNGAIPSTNNYLLEEEIILKEYDHTKINIYGMGHFDVKEIVDIPDIFWHEYSTKISRKTFLLAILNSDENVFIDNFIIGDIAEVRNHPGKYLHIYEIPEWYLGCKGYDFFETVKKINIQKEEEKKLDTYRVINNYRGVGLIFGITEKEYYESMASFGENSVMRQNEHDRTRRNHYKLMIMPCVPDGSYAFYVGKIPISLYLENGKEPSISVLTHVNFCNSQDWHYKNIQSLSIKEGWIFIDGQDVYQNTKKTIDELIENKKNDRINKFNEFSKIVSERYGEEILKLILRKKGSILSILKVFSEKTDIESTEVKKILELTSSSSVIESLISLVSLKISPLKAEKIANRAFAWAYLNSVFPGVKFSGHFDDASSALKIYADNWKENK